MSLTYVSQIGADGGIMQSAPNTGISEANVVWAQDVLFDRPGFIRRRGPLNSRGATEITSGEMIAGVTSTTDTIGDWHMCSLVSDSDSSRFVFYDSSGTLTGWSWLPFKHPNGSYLFENTTIQNKDIRVDNPMTMMIGRSALGGGAFISVFTRYGIPFYEEGGYPSFQSLYYWRGGHGIDCKTTNADIGIVSGFEGIAGDQGVQFSETITIQGALSASVTGETPLLTPGMFVFDDNAGKPYQCIGVVKTVNISGGTGTIVLEKRPMLGHNAGFNSTTNATSAINDMTLHFRNVRGFQHHHGRGLITLSTGLTVTSGLEGTSAEGHFAAAKMTQGDWYVYRASDHALIGKVNSAGSISNTQFELTSSNVKVKMTSDEYVAVKVMTTLSSDYVASSQAQEPSPYYQPRMSGKVDDASVGTSYDESVRTYKDVPGYLTATYAGFQWFGSLGQAGYENQILFSAYHNPEAVDLSPDSSDSIIIPGMNILRGMATSSAGLIIFMSDNTYILRGNDRLNFSLEVLYPEGCLSATSIVEIGGGVMWAAASGILYFDGASVRNLTQDSLGTYYYDGVRFFDAEADRIYSFVYKNYLFVSFTKWQSSYSFTRYEPVYVNTAAGDQEGQNITIDGVDYPPSTYTTYGYTWSQMTNRDAALTYEQFKNTLPFVTFAIYLPNGSVTSVSNMEFVGATFVDSINASTASDLDYDKSWIAINARKKHSSSHIPNKPVNAVTNVAFNSGTVTITFTPATTDTYANGDLVDLVDRNDTPIVSSATMGSLTTVGASKTFTYSAASAPTGVVGVVKPEYVTANRGYFVGLDNMLDVETNDYDDYITLASRWPGPDMYFQTKIYTIGDPVLKKWFQRLLISMLIKGGAVRVDMLDYENNDFITTQVKQRNWALLPEYLYTWSQVESSQFALITGESNPVTWQQVEAYATNNSNLSWDDLLFPAFERRMKKFSLRTQALGYQFYQLNRWKPNNSASAAILKPKRIETDAWSIGFKPMRSGRQ